MAVSTASFIPCPKCGQQTSTYAASKKVGVKVRYRKCSKCNTHLKTVQQLDNLEAGEAVVPVLTQEEQNKFLADLRAKQVARRAVMNRANKLNVREVAEIKYLVHSKVQTPAYTAMQYGVEKVTIERIVAGTFFAHVKTPRSLADL